MYLTIRWRRGTGTYISMKSAPNVRDVTAYWRTASLPLGLNVKHGFYYRLNTKCIVLQRKLLLRWWIKECSVMSNNSNGLYWISSDLSALLPRSVQLMYAVIHTIIELSLLQLIFRISLFVCYCCELIQQTHECAPSLELDAYLVSAFVRYRITSRAVYKGYQPVLFPNRNYSNHY